MPCIGNVEPLILVQNGLYHFYSHRPTQQLGLIFVIPVFISPLLFHLSQISEILFPVCLDLLTLFGHVCLHNQ